MLADFCLNYSVRSSFLLPCICAASDGRQRLLAVDCAQQIYDMDKHDSIPFWTSVKALQQAPHASKVRVIFTASYSPALCTPQDCSSAPPGVTPLAINTAITTVSIHPAPLDGVSVRLTAKEVQELWDAWVAHTQLKGLGDVVKDMIVETCASQVCPRWRADEAKKLKYY